MKKGFLLVAFALFALVGVTSCGGGTETPEAVAEKWAECYKSQDGEGMVDLIYFDEEMSDEDVEDAKKVLIPTLEVSAKKDSKDKDGIKDVEVKKVEISKSDEERASCEIKITFGNGSKKTEYLSLRKTDDGWRVRMY